VLVTDGCEQPLGAGKTTDGYDLVNGRAISDPSTKALRQQWLFWQPGHAQALDQRREVGRILERLEDSYLSQLEIGAKSQQLRDKSAGLVHQAEVGMGRSEIEAMP